MGLSGMRWVKSRLGPSVFPTHAIAREKLSFKLQHQHEIKALLSLATTCNWQTGTTSGHYWRQSCHSPNLGSYLVLLPWKERTRNWNKGEKGMKKVSQIYLICATSILVVNIKTILIKYSSNNINAHSSGSIKQMDLEEYSNYIFLLFILSQKYYYLP